jgi:hypothetical protein
VKDWDRASALVGLVVWRACSTSRMRSARDLGQSCLVGFLVLAVLTAGLAWVGFLGFSSSSPCGLVPCF